MDSIKKDVLQYIRSRVLQAGKPVTVNQLCKPITKEMKTLLLGSKKNNYVEALEEFLKQNSTVSTVEDGTVHLNPRQGNYDDIQWTKEYFLYELRENDGKPVLITDLFSNRHNDFGLSPEIKYFSGLEKSIEDFTAFLNQHKDTFNVFDGFVVPAVKTEEETSVPPLKKRYPKKKIPKPIVYAPRDCVEILKP